MAPSTSRIIEVVALRLSRGSDLRLRRVLVSDLVGSELGLVP